MVWADNLYCVGHNTADTIKMIELIGDRLMADWALQWKPTSLKILANEKSPQATVLCKAHGFECEKKGVTCLGHYISKDGTYHAAVRQLQSALLGLLLETAAARLQTASQTAVTKPRHDGGRGHAVPVFWNATRGDLPESCGLCPAEDGIHHCRSRNIGGQASECIAARDRSTCSIALENGGSLYSRPWWPVERCMGQTVQELGPALAPTSAVPCGDHDERDLREAPRGVGRMQN
jgi:hypothetical protein